MISSSLRRALAVTLALRRLALILVALLLPLWTAGAAIPAGEAESRAYRVESDDGASLSLKRYAGPGAPVLLVHGLAANRRCFDLESVPGPEGGYWSLAEDLRRAGLDVWLLNLRGAGRSGEASQLPPGQSGWSIDDHIASDLPAAIEQIRHERPVARPFLLGHSMGALVVIGYLEGARFEARDADESGARELRLDAALARTRQAETRGAVLVAPALRMEWRDGRRPLWLSYPAQAALLLRLRRVPERLELARWTLSDAVSSITDEFAESASAEKPPASDRKPDSNSDSAVDSDSPPASVPAPDSDSPPDSEATVASPSFLERILARVYGPADGRRAVLFKKFLRGVIDDTSRRVLRQFLDGIRHETMRSTGLGLVDFADAHLDVATPLLVILGRNDHLIDHAIVERDLIEKAVHAPDAAEATLDRRLVTLDAYGHVDLLLGATAPREVYPLVRGWLESRASASAKDAR